METTYSPTGDSPLYEIRAIDMGNVTEDGLIGFRLHLSIQGTPTATLNLCILPDGAQELSVKLLAQLEKRGKAQH